MNAQGADGERVGADLVEGWTFARQWMPRRWLAGEGPGGEPVELPHCVNAHHDGDADALAYRGWASYRLRLSGPAAQDGPSGCGVGGRRLWRLEVLPVYGRVEVALDGRRIARFDGQYLGAWIDLSRFGARPGAGHVLGIRVDNRHRLGALPGHRNPDFLLYGGLAGGVRLWRVPPLHLVTRATHARCRFVARALGAGGDGEVEVSLTVSNDSAESRQGTLEARLFDPRGELAAASALRELRLETGERRAETITLAALRVEPWSPQRPVLYRLEITLADRDAATCDRQVVRLGWRTLEWTREGLLVNGEPLRLRGVNRHDSMPGFGTALPRALMRRDAELLKELGANCVRLVHHPQHPYFLDACDELGLFVYPELASWNSVNAGPWWWAARRQLRALVARDRNRPSILLWGLGNESRSRWAYGRLRRLARALDPDRATCYAEHRLSRARHHRTAALLDVYGANYELPRLERARQRSRHGAVLVTECMNVARASPEAADRERAQLELMLAERALLDRHPWLVGWLVWSFSDYRTEHRGRGVRNSGLFDAWRRPRLGAHLFRAWHATRPFIHLDGDWGFESAAAVRRITVITNLPAIELRSGPAVLVRTPMCAVACFELPFTGRPLSARGTGGAAGAAAELAPWGKAQALRVGAGDPLPGTGGCSALDIEAIDGGGVRARDFAGSARLVLAAPPGWRLVSAAGVLAAGVPAAGVGTVELAVGSARVYLCRGPGGRGDQEQPPVVEVSCPGLAPARLACASQPVPGR